MPTNTKTLAAKRPKSKSAEPSSKICGFAPIADAGSTILILGSMPGEKSLKFQEYYGNPANHFWKILALIFKTTLPLDYSAKKKMLRKHRIALWDVLSACSRRGSLDSAICRGTVNDFAAFLKKHPSIRLIVLNGKTAGAFFQKTAASGLTIPFVCVPSSSSANARLGVQQKAQYWKEAMKIGVQITKKEPNSLNS